MLLTRPTETIQCSKCNEPLTPDQPAMFYAGKWCHLPCVAVAQRKEFFRNSGDE